MVKLLFDYYPQQVWKQENIPVMYVTLIPWIGNEMLRGRRRFGNLLGVTNVWNTYTRGSQSLHSRVQIWIVISVKGLDRNDWLLQNLFLINIQYPITCITNKHIFFEKNKVPFAFKIH